MTQLVEHSRLTISAPHITTQKSIGFKSQGKIKTGYTESSSHFAQQTSDLGFIWQSRTNEGHDHTTILLPHMSAPEGVSFSSPEGIEVTVKAPSQVRLLTNWHQSKGGFLSQKGNSGLENALAVLETTPETAWIKSLRHNPAVNWHLVSEVHKEWNETTQGLAPGAGVLISLAVAIATQGWGSGLMGPGLLTSVAEGLAISAKTVGIMVDAGLTTLLSQTATSLIGNQFDLSKTFQQLTSKENLLALGTSIGTAGLTFGLSDKLGVSLNGTDFFDRLQRSAVQTGASTALRIMTDNLDVSEALQQGFVNVVAMSVGGWAANHIGEMYHPTPILLQDGTLVVPESSIGWLEHKGLHFGLGFLEGMASDLKHPLRGAWGGGFGALGGVTLMELSPTSLNSQNRADVALMGSTLLSFLGRQDVNASVLTATNAIENNCRLHPAPTWEMEQNRLEQSRALVDYCTTPNPTMEKGKTKFLNKTGRQMDQLVVATKDPQSSFLQRMDARARYSLAFEQFSNGLLFSTTPFGIALDGSSLIPSMRLGKEIARPCINLIRQIKAFFNLEKAIAIPVAKMIQQGERIPVTAVKVKELSFEAPKLKNVVDISSFSPSSKIVPLERRGYVMFDGVEFRAVRDLSHMSEKELWRIYKGGFSPRDLEGRDLIGHHHLQKYHRDSGAFIVEIPTKHHKINNPIQHPYGNQKGAGLTLEQRLDWDKLRVKFNKERAKEELKRRGLLNDK